MELPNAAAARVLALESIADILAERIAQGGRINLEHSIEVLDEHRQPVLQLPFSEFGER